MVSAYPPGQVMPAGRFVGLDPGRNIGVAVVDALGRLEQRAIITLGELVTLTLPVDAVVLVGDGTGSALVQAVLRRRGVAFRLVDERGTSLEARTLYFRDHPPRGPMRLLPRGLWSPAEGVDDYAAYALVLRYLRSRGGVAG